MDPLPALPPFRTCVRTGFHESQLRKYNGYRFTSREEYVCNPFSVINAMDDRTLYNYWVMSGSSKFEFKLDGPPSEALWQIDDRGYSLQWEARGRKVTKIGVEYSSKLRTIVGWEIGLNI